MIYLVLLIVAISFIIGLNIVRIVDTRLSEISINMPKINVPVLGVTQDNSGLYRIKCACDPPKESNEKKDATEKFTNYIVPEQAKDIPEVVSVKGDVIPGEAGIMHSVIQVTNKPETTPNKPESPRTFEEQITEKKEQPTTKQPEQLLYAPTAEDYYRNEYYYLFTPQAYNEIWQPYNINYYENRGTSEDRTLQNPDLNKIESYEYLIQNRQY